VNVHLVVFVVGVASAVGNVCHHPPFAVYSLDIAYLVFSSVVVYACILTFYRSFFVATVVLRPNLR
jgi:hypothetical protein